MIRFLKRLIGMGAQENRRKYERYPVTAPLQVAVGVDRFECAIENVSAGGVKLTPALDAKVGDFITILHPKSQLTLEATVVGIDNDGTRAEFKSPEAGTVVAVWVHMLHEEA